jgi:tRNA A-37 threonylcarbamoyl transferase component Bud32
LKTCSRCGAVLAAGDELCARCLLALGREASPEGEPRETVRRARKRPTPPLEEIAARFPELELLALIGEGGMGAVYKARQAKIDRLVALKVLGFDPDDHPAFAERFRREGRALARLDHPNVVKLFDFGERDGLFYLVLEFVDGTNLRALMRQGALEPRQALAIVPQICEALQFAHDEGVVHRDIKPENVLVDSKGRVKIADFGLAKLVDAGARDSSLTDVGQVMGTPDYMAPEQLRGERGVDHRADIYSLGVVFYEMLTGALPRGNFALPSKQIHVDVRLDEIVLKTLEVTPELRYQHAVEVKTDVEGVGSAELRARPAGGGDRPAEPEPGWRWHYVLAFLGLWPLAGWGFNEGPAWWVTMTALVAATFWALLHSEIGDRAGALEAGSRRVSAARQLSAALLLVLGFSLLWLGHIAVFDRLASNYRPGPGDPESMQALESRLLPELESRLSLTWPVDRSRSSSRACPSGRWTPRRSITSRGSCCSHSHLAWPRPPCSARAGGISPPGAAGACRCAPPARCSARCSCCTPRARSSPACAARTAPGSPCSSAEPRAAARRSARISTSRSSRATTASRRRARGATPRPTLPGC